MAWTIEYLKEAEKDLLGLDHSRRLQVLILMNKEPDVWEQIISDYSNE